MARVDGWSESELAQLEDEFATLVRQALAESFRVVTLHMERVVTAATISNTPSDPTPVLQPAQLGIVAATWNVQVTQKLREFLINVFTRAAGLVFGKIQSRRAITPDDVNLFNDAAQQHAALFQQRLLDVGGEVIEAARASLNAGLAGGESTEQLSQRVHEVIESPKGDVTQTTRAAVVTAANAGSLAAVQLGGFTDDEAFKIWLATDDERTRPCHREADGQRVPLSQSFDVCDEGLPYPGWPGGRADNVLGCRCTLTYEFSDDDVTDEESLAAQLEVASLHTSDYSDPVFVVTAAGDPDWDPSEHPRNPNDGKFIKKGTSVAKIPTVTKSSIKMGPLTVVGGSQMQHVMYNGKSIAYAKHKISKNTGKPVTDLYSLDDATKKIAQVVDPQDIAEDIAELINDGHLPAVAKEIESHLSKSDAPSTSDTPVVAVGKPKKINTKVIYGTKYDHDAVVAVRNTGASVERLTWDDTLKKFKLLKLDKGNGKGWKLQQVFGKGAAYSFFKDQTGWHEPGNGDKKASTDVISPTTSAEKVTKAEPKKPDYYSMPPATLVKYLEKLGPKGWHSLPPNEQAAIDDAAGNHWAKGKPAAKQLIGKFENDESAPPPPPPPPPPPTPPSPAKKYAPPKKPMLPSNFDSMTPPEFAEWYENLSQDKYDALSTDEQSVVDQEAIYQANHNFPFLKKKIEQLESGTAGDPQAPEPDPDAKAIEMGQWDAYEFMLWADYSLDEETWNSFTPNEQEIVELQANNLALEKKNHKYKNLIKQWKGTATPAPTKPLSEVTDKQELHDYAQYLVPSVDTIGVPHEDDDDTVTFSTVGVQQMKTVQNLMLAKEQKTWTSANIAAVSAYTTSTGYQTMNAVLRNDQKRMGMFSTATLQNAVQQAADLQDAMTPFAMNVKLFRGTGAQAFGFKGTNVDFDSLKALEGSVVTDKGFVSTTIVENPKVEYDYAKKPIRIELDVPSGTPAVFVSSATPSWSKENEVILAAGSSFEILEVREATASDKQKFGSHLQQVVRMRVVPTPEKSDITPEPATPAAPPAVPEPKAVSSTSAAQSWNAHKPIKINTKVIYGTTYQHGAVVAIKPFKSGVNWTTRRLVWNENAKKFVFQKQDPVTEQWLPDGAPHTKKATYDLLKNEDGWFAPTSGATAIDPGGSTGVGAPTPKVSGSTSSSVTVTPPPAKAVKQPKFTAEELQKLKGGVPPALNYNEITNFFASFKHSYGFTTLNSKPFKIFNSLVQATNHWNLLQKNHPDKQLNLLQALNVIDARVSGNGGTNLHLYEAKIVEWLGTAAGANTATKTLNTVALTPAEKLSQTLALAETFVTADKISLPRTDVEEFKPINYLEAREMQKRISSGAGKALSVKAKSSIKSYSGSQFTDINSVLRGKVSVLQGLSEQSKTHARAHAANIQSGMRPIDRNIIVHRGTGFAQFPGLHDHDSFAHAYATIQALEGKTITDHGFVSTSVNEHSSFGGNVKLTIEVPEGAPAAYIETISSHKSEYEMLLAAGTKFKVLSVTKGPYTASSIRVRLRVVP